MGKKSSLGLLLCLVFLLVFITACGNQTATTDKSKSAQAPTSSKPEQPASQQAGKSTSSGLKVKLFQGPPQGTWNPIANAIKKIIEDKVQGSTVSFESGAGASNVIAANSGKGEFAMVVSNSAVDGLKGLPPFNAKMQDIREVAVLYEQPQQILTFNPNIKSVNDLKGKKVSVMQKGYGAELVNQIILKAHGMSYNDIDEQFLGENDSAESMRDGHIDAIMYAGNIPTSVVIDLASTGKLRLVSLSDDMIKKISQENSALHKYIIPKGTFSGVNEEVGTIASSVNIVSNKNVSDDIVYAFTKALVEGLPELQKQFAFFKEMNAEAMARDLGVPMHPGAEKYYKEAKILK